MWKYNKHLLTVKELSDMLDKAYNDGLKRGVRVVELMAIQDEDTDVAYYVTKAHKFFKRHNLSY